MIFCRVSCKLAATVLYFANLTVFVSASAANESFPALMDAYDRKTEIQKEPFIKGLVNQSLSGSGFIDEVDKCGFGDSHLAGTATKFRSSQVAILQSFIFLRRH